MKNATESAIQDLLGGFRCHPDCGVTAEDFRDPSAAMRGFFILHSLTFWRYVPGGSDPLPSEPLSRLRLRRPLVPLCGTLLPNITLTSGCSQTANPITYIFQPWSLKISEAWRA